MDATHKKTLKSIILEIRHLLEGRYDAQNNWQPGDLERRLAAMGVRRDRKPLPMDEMPQLSEPDKRAREVVDAYLSLRIKAGIDLAEAVAEFVRETAYSWANRLLALRCMEARELIDEVILQKSVYGGRSLEHHRLVQRQPESCSGDDDGLFAVLEKIFSERAETLPLLFDPRAPGVALKPTPSAVMRCVRLLSGTEQVNGQTSASDDVFKAPDALGWAYQYWNTEEKDRVFEKVRTQKGAKIQGADIIPATQLYTEPYMVKFLVQNSLGATWAGMHPDTGLMDGWEYFVRDADRASARKKPVQDITFLDPACGSGHFLIEAFDLFYAMYEEKGHLTESEAICQSILENNLFGIDIDERAVQIAEAALWMKAAEKAFDFAGAATNLVATNIRLPKGKDHLEEFLKKHPEDKPIRPALEVIFEGLAHADELGSLLQIEEPVERELKHLKKTDDRVRSHGTAQGDLFRPTAVQDQLPFGIQNYDEWRKKTVVALKEHFAAEAESADLGQAFFGTSAGNGLKLFDFLAKKYDVVAANPPYLGTKRQGDLLKGYLANHYSRAKYDLYASFIVRMRALISETGIAGFVTRSSWLYQKWYQDLRESAIDEGWLNIIIQLGSGAFEDFGGDVVDVSLQLSSASPTKTIFMSSLSRVIDKKTTLPIVCTLGDIPAYSCDQFLAIPGFVISPTVQPSTISIFESCDCLRDIAEVTDSVVVVSRFLRYWWEVRGNERWHPYSKGGGLDRWHGLEFYSLDWGHQGLRLKSYVLGRYPTSKFRLIVKEENKIGQAGLTWTTYASGTLSVRQLSNGYIVSSKGPGIYCSNKEDELWVLALLNSRLASYLMRIISPGQEFGYKYVEGYPIPSVDSSTRELLKKSARRCLETKKALISIEPTERSFDVRILVAPFGSRPSSLQDYIISLEIFRIEASLVIMQSTAEIETVCQKAYKIDKDKAGLEIIYSTVGELPWLYVPKNSTNSRNREFIYSTYLGEKLKSATQELSENQETDDYENGFYTGLPVKEDTAFGRICQKLGLHPKHVGNLIKEGLRAKEIQPPNKKTIIYQIISTIIMEVLGTLWPKQVKNNELIPEWADQDGIIPLTDGMNEQTLLNRVRERISAEFEVGDVSSIEREFAEITRKSLEQWLETEFFKHHVKQFKKRPIAWQIQSEKYARNNKPAFACLIYYHKLDGDLLPKIRTQYVGLLRQRCETELRGIEALPLDARSDRQEKRRIELETQIEELKHFDIKLKNLTESAFGPERMFTRLRQNALEDSMLCLKAQWLKKLSGIMQQGPLKDWLTLAEKARLDEKLPEWIMEPVYNLHYFCSKVGADTPKEETFKDDPGAGELAEIICSRAEDMVKGSLRLVCTSWWKNLDDAVLTPLRKRIRDLQEELKVLKEKEAVEGKENPHLIVDFEVRIETLKIEMKTLRKKLKDKTEKAKRIREEIESWSNADALTWEPWLAGRNMYDAISGIDGQHHPAGSIQDFIRQESTYLPDINDGVRVNIAPLQKAGVLAGDVIAKKDLEKAISDRAEWRADERRWCREGKLPQPGWWPTAIQDNP